MRFPTLAALSLLMISCGVVHTGTSTNDTTPTTPLIASGNFPCGQVCGTAGIYGSNGSYTLRLSSFTAPSASNLEARVYAGGSIVATVILTATTGSKNYTFSESISDGFQQVVILSGSSLTEYGTATLQ